MPTKASYSQGLVKFLARKWCPLQTIKSSMSIVRLACWKDLTIRYKSGFPRDCFDFEMLGAAMVGSSSPGILCLTMGYLGHVVMG